MGTITSKTRSQRDPFSSTADRKGCVCAGAKPRMREAALRSGTICLATSLLQRGFQNKATPNAFAAAQSLPSLRAHVDIAFVNPHSRTREVSVLNAGMQSQLASAPSRQVRRRPAKQQQQRTVQLASGGLTLSHLFATGPRGALQRLMALNIATVPPQIFFWLLMLAGCGVPISEDLLCIYVGALLPTLEMTRRLQLIAALYWGVVLSDWITYVIGRLLGEAYLKTQSAEAAESEGGKPTKLQQAQQLVQSSGRQVGFALRVAVGLRVPMLLLCGLGRVPFWRQFVPYNLLGALVSLSVQLTLGAVAFRAAPAAAVSGGLAMLLPCLAAVAVLCALAAAVLRALGNGRV